MSDHHTNTPSPAGLLEIARALGALQATFNHYVEDQSRAFAEQRSEYGERFDALETARDEDRALLNDMRMVIEQLATVVEKQVSSTGGNKPKNAAAEATAPTTYPARKEREQTSAYRARLVTWADEHGFESPPKLKNLEDRTSYDRRVAAWGSTLAT